MISSKLSALLVVVSLTMSASPYAFAKAKAAPAKEAESSKEADNTTRYENLELFQKVLHFVESNYVDETKNKELVYGAIKGMLETLDPHSSFLTPKVFAEMKIDTSGKYGGVGIELGRKDDVLTVIAPIEDTPAWKAGLKPNDRVVKIDGESTKGMDTMEAVSKMRGKAGSTITLSIYREGFDKVRDVKIAREMIKMQSVKSDLLEPRFGYVRLTNFNESAAGDIKKAIEKLENGGPNNRLKGLVLDLRMNPGGLLDQAVEVSSLFLDEGAVVSTIGRNRDQKEVKYAKKGNARKDFPVAVLVNSSSASAAEIVAGALQDHKRAIIMGQPTFGKGSVQTVIPLNNELGLKLTIARYYTPSGRSIQEKGVQPDIIVEEYDPKLLAEAKRSGPSFREKDLKGHMLNPDGDSGDEKADESSSSEKTAKKLDFSKSELEMLGKTDKKSKKGEKEIGDEEMVNVRVSPKEDYQVKEALNYLKSYELFRKLAVDGGEAKVEAKADASAAPVAAK